MKLEHLRSVTGFADLKNDHRFVALIAYLSANPSARRKAVTGKTSAIRNEGCFNGWFDCLKEIEEVTNPPTQPDSRTTAQPYTVSGKK